MSNTDAVAFYGINYRPEPTGIGPYTAELAEEMVKSGLAVRVITTFAHYPQWKVDRADAKVWRRREVLNGVSVLRLRTRMPRPMTGVQRLLFELSYLLSAIMHGPGDAGTVVGIIPGLGSGLAAAVHGRLRRRRVVIVVQDLAGRGLRQSGLSSARALGALAGAAENLAIRWADQVIVISDNFVKPLEDSGISPSKMRVLSNWSKETATPELAVAPQPASAVTLLHAGSMGMKQGLEQLVATAAEASKRGRDWKFVLVGDGSERRRLELLATGLDNVEFRDPVSGGEFPSLLASAQVLLLFQAPTNIDMSFPSKLTSYFGAGVPVVAVVAQEGPVGQLLESTGSGLVAAPGCPAATVDALDALLNDPARAKRYVTAALEYRKLAWNRPELITEWQFAICGNNAHRKSKDLFSA